MIRFVVAFVSLALFASLPAFASDGVIEINQAIAIAGGVNGDVVADPPGFPVRITQGGSYRLTGNLVIPLGTSGIRIDSIFVTLDLGGFAVSGPNSCTGYPTVSCTHQTVNPAIVSEQFLVVVRNGSVVSSEGPGIELSGASSEIDQVRVLACGGTDIAVGGAGRVSRSFSGGNLINGIGLEDGGITENNETRANKNFGIAAGVSSARLSGAVIGNRAFDNGFGGISVRPGTLVSRNVSSDNANAQIAGGVSLSDNLCGGTLC